MKKWQIIILTAITTIVIAVGGSIALLFFANKDSVVTTQTGDSGVAKTIPLTRTLEIKEWNVRMHTSELVDQGYSFKDNDNVMFSSGNQKMLSNGCIFKNQTAGPWGVRRYKNSDPHPDKLLVVGDYAYEFIAPTGGCEEYKGAVESLNNSYATMYRTIEKIQ